MSRFDTVTIAPAQSRSASILDEDRYDRLIRLSARAFARSLTLRLASEKVTFGQWVFLRILWQTDGLSQRELSERANLTEPTTHAALLRMEEAGFIVRRNTNGNRRRQHAFLTERGWALRDTLEPLAADANDVAVAGLTPDERQILLRGLRTMIGNLEADEAAAVERGERIPSTRSQGTG